MDKFIDRALFDKLLSELCDRCDMYWVDGYCKKNCKWAKYHFALEKLNKEKD